MPTSTAWPASALPRLARSFVPAPASGEPNRERRRANRRALARYTEQAESVRMARRLARRPAVPGALSGQLLVGPASYLDEHLPPAGYGGRAAAASPAGRHWDVL